MREAGKSKKFRKIIVAMLIPAIFACWFVTAPAGMAVQRIAAGTGRGPVALFIIDAAEWYEAPMRYVDKIPALKRLSDPLVDRWCELLNAPETTP